MNKSRVFFIIVLAAAGLNLGTVRKAEDPIRDTQTNPILYEQKKEEEKDGKKGPLLYHVKNYPRETFFIDPPFEASKTSSEGAAVVTEKAHVPAEAADWWEEQPAGSQAGSFAEAPAKPLQESFPATEEVRNPEAAEPPVSGTDAESPPAGKEDDYWW